MKRWNIAETQFLKENVHQLTDEQLAAELTKITGQTFTMTSVRRKRQRLGLKKVQGRGHCALTNDTFIKSL